MSQPENYYIKFYPGHGSNVVNIYTGYKGYQASFHFQYEENNTATDDEGKTVYAMVLTEVTFDTPNKRRIVVSRDEWPQYDNDGEQENESVALGIRTYYIRSRWIAYDVKYKLFGHKVSYLDEQARWDRMGLFLYGWTKKFTHTRDTFNAFLATLEYTMDTMPIEEQSNEV